ncbi:MAG: elongation factor G [Nitrospirae bacterium]|nr:elongation factor G [Nitrospirota bacterium]
MSDIDVKKIRNVAVIGHHKSGKTTLVETMLLNAGVITRTGAVENGNTVTDFEPEEIERKISVSSAVVHFDWLGHKINLIDTPGFINFLQDSRGCLKVADSAIVLSSAISGIKAETVKAWEYADEFNLPRVIFVNKMNRENADFKMALKAIEDTFAKEAVALNIPIGAGETFQGIVDILHMKAYKATDGKPIEIPLPPDMADTISEYRKRLVEKIAESDDKLIEKYLDGQELTQDEIVKGLHEGDVTQSFIPVLCGTGAKNVGVAELMDVIVQCLPSPDEMAKISKVTAKDLKTGEKIILNPSVKEPMSLYVFKTIADPFAGKLSLFRVFTGQLKADSFVYNSTKGVKERVGSISYLVGKNQIQTSVLGPGDIGVVAKLKDTVTGDTLCDESRQISIDPMVFAEPMISYAITPKTKGDEEKVSTGLHRILDEDPTLRFHRDPDSNELIISGMGQAHLEVTLHKLKRKFGVEVELHSPQVPYKETIKKKSVAQGKYKKQSGGRGQYGDCHIEIEPLPHGGGFEFINAIVGGAIPKNYIPAIEKGIVDKMKQGILAGYPLVDVKVTVFDGSYHTVDSSEMAFKMAGSFAIRKAVMDASPILLEPIVKAEFYIPDETLGIVIGDLNGRRGRVQGVESQTGGTQQIIAFVPMSEMLTYANQLHSMTSGRGIYSMEMAHYEEVPSHIAQKIIDSRKKDEEET